MKAIWNGAVLAQSDDTVVVEGNHYFPVECLDRRYFVESGKHSVCPWKGVASYCTVVVDGEENRDAAWYYQRPSPLAGKIRGRVAFWRGVKVVADDRDAGDVESSAPLLGRLLAGLRRAA
jgi:uncharacterized protein (DUF427 family)